MAILPSQTDPAAAGASPEERTRQPDPGLFFASPAHARLLDLLRHLAENTDQVALLSGWQGAGKTTLLYRVLGEAPRHWQSCRVDANPMMHPDQLLNCLARCVDLVPNDPELNEQIPGAFAALRQEGLLPVVVVDDADQLPPSSLMSLLRLFEQRTEGVPPFSLILLAEPLIETTLDTPQLHAMGTDRFNRLRMPPLESGQIGDYIRHFLRVEGVEGHLTLTAEQLQRIGKESEGLPGRVNDLVLRVLREPGERVAPRLPLASWLRQLQRIPPATLLPAAAVFLVLALGLWFQDDINRLFQGSGDHAGPTPDMEDGGALPGAGSPKVRSLALPPEPVAMDAPEPPPGPPRDAEDTGELPISEPLIPPRAMPPQSLPLPAPETPVAEPAPETEAAPPVTEPGSQKVPPAKPEPAQHPRRKRSTEPTDDGLKKEAWLLKQQADAYTLQLLGVSEEQALRSFIRRHRLEKDVFYFETRRNGRPWFVLLHGIYRDRDAAVTSLNKLPEALRRAGAWPRPLGGIQEAIRNKRR